MTDIGRQRTDTSVLRRSSLRHPTASFASFGGRRTEDRQWRTYQSSVVRPLFFVLRPPKRSLPAWWLLQGGSTRSHPELGRQTPSRQWYYVSRPGRVGRRQACKERNTEDRRQRTNKSSLCRQTSRGAQSADLGRTNPSSVIRPPFSAIAGWSSPVARQAHNLKAAGSNPAPATKPSSKPKSEKKAPDARAPGAFLRRGLRTRLRKQLNGYT